MHGTIGILIGVIVVVVGLAGLGVALMEMMTQAEPQASIKALGGLGTFLGACLVMLIIAR